MLEILLTRIFSVTLWYHLAFVAVSIAMFGMTLGAVVVYVVPSWFTPDRLRAALAGGAALFGITSVWSIQTHLGMAIDPAQLTDPLRDLSMAYGIISIPFVFSGIAVSLALTRFPLQLSQLYAADLAGAAVGCGALIVLIETLGGPPVVLVVAGASALAAVLFAIGSPVLASRGRIIAAAVVTVAVFGWTIDRAVAGPQGLKVRHAKGVTLTQPLHEKWNSYSRIEVSRLREEPPFGWGLSQTFKPTYALGQLHVNIDASAETVMTAFDGDLGSVGHLRYDVTNIGHYLTKNGSVFVIGAGGGRDVLSALVFGQRQVTAVEMNRAIIEAVNDRFGDVTGHLDRRPGVRFVNDEARSYLARSPERFDLIQISLIDTWAATAAGAFVLSENTLYTADAWELFWSRLTDNGTLSVSRWYSRRDPGELYKVTALATDALTRVGVTDPRRHLMIVATRPGPGEDDGASTVATLLVRKSPFIDADTATIGGLVSQMGFEFVLNPSATTDPTLNELADPARVEAAIDRIGTHLIPPTDDRPFFFKMDSILLNGLLRFVVILSLAFVIVPIALRSIVWRSSSGVRVGLTPGDVLPSLAFAAIGIAFMLIEIALMQRLTLLLGHPTFSLSVALAGILIASGAGAFSTRHITEATAFTEGTRRFGGLLVALAVVGLAAPPAIAFFQGSSTPIRVAVALVLVVIPGFFMGMPFPMAMKLAETQRPGLAAWLWGINGAASICASVLAVMISSSRGISVAWWTGVAAYVVAAALVLADARGLPAATSERPAPAAAR